MLAQQSSGWNITRRELCQVKSVMHAKDNFAQSFVMFQVHKILWEVLIFFGGGMNDPSPRWTQEVHFRPLPRWFSSRGHDGSCKVWGSGSSLWSGHFTICKWNLLPDSPVPLANHNLLPNWNLLHYVAYILPSTICKLFCCITAVACKTVGCIKLTNINPNNNTLVPT